MGGDTDTIGAITGGIAGIIYGYDAIPTKWEKDLENKELLYQTASRLEKLYIEHTSAQINPGNVL